MTLRKRFPDSPVWNHAVFQHEAYEAFAERMQTVVGDDEERLSQLNILTQAMPVLTDYLHFMNARIEAGNNRVQEALSGIEEQVRAQSAYGAQLHQQLTSGSFTFQIKLADDAPSSWSRASAPPTLPPILSLLGSSCYASARVSLAPDDRCLSPSAALLQEPPEPPRHSMCRSVKTVEAL